MSTPKIKSRSRALTSKVLFHIHTILAESDGRVAKKEIHRRLASDLAFTDWEAEPAGRSQQPRWRHALWYTTDAARAGFMEKSGNGLWRITSEGRKALELGPDGLLDAAAEGYKKWRAAHGSSTPSGAQGVVRGQVLRACIQLLERSPGRSMLWSEVAKRVSPLLPEDTLEVLASREGDWQGSYSYHTFAVASRAGFLVRQSGVLTLAEAGIAALAEWQDPQELWEAARQSAGKEPDANTEPIPYLGNVADYAGSPQSLYQVQSDSIGHLMGSIKQGALALPDIQRPFVWKNTKVRDLFDSLFRGFPFGYLLTWKSPEGKAHATLGGHASATTMPDALVIDGQQRLTSLFAVISGQEIVDKEFRKRRIHIAFHPLSARFEVADAAIRKNPEWLDDISKVFTDEMGALSVVQSYLKRLEQVREILPEHRRAVETNVSRLVNLTNLQVNVLQIGIHANEEEVAEIFVRINSKGQRLNQADFILTLLAVFWPKGRENLENFAKQCRLPSADETASPFNRKLQPGPGELVRVVVAVGHHRARLSAAYQVLRGKNPQTGEVSDDIRTNNIQILAEAQDEVLSIAHWHEFLKVLSAAGFKHKKLIWSELSTLFAYSLFLIGRTQFNVSLPKLRRTIGRWYLMSVVTSRYVGGSSESAMEEDLARVFEATDADKFLAGLEAAMVSELTNDFWQVTLPSRMESSSSRTLSPFFAAQSVLGAKALFSTLGVGELLDPSAASTKSDLEIHHLFPKAWLQKNGVTSPKDYNQIANMGLLEWSANIEVSDDAPTDYAPRLEERMKRSEAERDEANRLQALPDDWWDLDYDDFLHQRRELMADVVRMAFEKIR
jgi:hypothetical protein